MRFLVFLLLAVGCGGSSNDGPKASVSEDAGVVASVAPSDAQPTPQPTSVPIARPQRSARTIEIILRSTPPGATAAVDGKVIGTTPTLWVGTADRRPHEFTFTLSGYSAARYRFVSTRSGIVHGTLKQLVTAPDAGP